LPIWSEAAVPAVTTKATSHQSVMGDAPIRFVPAAPPAVSSIPRKTAHLVENPVL